MQGHWETYKGKKYTTYRYTIYDGYDAQGKRVRFRDSIKVEPGTKKTEVTALKRDLQRRLEGEVTKYREGKLSNTRNVVSNRITFSRYSDTLLKQKEQEGTQHRTIDGYRKLLERIDLDFGDVDIQDIQPSHLREFYSKLRDEDARNEPDRAVPKVDLRKALKAKGLSMAKTARMAGVAESTVNVAGKGNAILRSKAEQIAAAAKISFDELFAVEKRDEPLSGTTALAYHRFIHMVLEEAKREALVQYNVADNVKAPRKDRSKVTTFQLDEIEAIIEAADQEPIKWRAIIHMLIVTTCRRGELCASKWDLLDWDRGSIHINSSLAYTPERGVYETTTKTGEERNVALPMETLEILREYREWQEQEKKACGDLWVESPYIFTGLTGGMMSPDTLGSYLQKFEKKYNLPHIHAHKFRHTGASLMFRSGADEIRVSRHLGHAQPSTTQDIYGHAFDSADAECAEMVADVVYRKCREKKQ